MSIVPSKSVIQCLENPCTNEYLKLKEHVNGVEMGWFYFPCTIEDNRGIDCLQSNDAPFYSHMIMERPNKENGTPFSKITSELFPSVYTVLSQIFEHNNIDPSVIYRINFNSSFAFNVKSTPYHVDLDIPHKNLIVYMSTFNGGRTLVKDGEEEIAFNPEEDKIILFDGMRQHCSEVPTGNSRRIVLVACFH